MSAQPWDWRPKSDDDRGRRWRGDNDDRRGDDNDRRQQRRR